MTSKVSQMFCEEFVECYLEKEDTQVCITKALIKESKIK